MRTLWMETYRDRELGWSPVSDSEGGKSEEGRQTQPSATLTDGTNSP